MAGDATNEYDFQKSFAIDNVVVNVVSIFIVLLVLLFTFQSVGMPILLIVVIQGAIWINFSFPYFMGTNLYFMGYLTRQLHPRWARTSTTPSSSLPVSTS